MIGLLQRVSHARVDANDQVIAAIGTGLAVLVGMEKNDNEEKANRLLQRLLGYRVFPDSENKMNLSLADIHGDLLLVPQFTLPADTRKGMRPSFSPAASPDLGRRLFEHLVASAKGQYPRIASGRFGADMQVTLTNDGPVTFWLQA